MAKRILTVNRTKNGHCIRSQSIRTNQYQEGFPIRLAAIPVYNTDDCYAHTNFGADLNRDRSPSRGPNVALPFRTRWRLVKEVPAAFPNWISSLFTNHSLTEHHHTPQTSDHCGAFKKPIADEMSRAKKSKAYDRTMPYLPEHLSCLRQEIADLQKMNTHYSNKSEHSSLDKSAFELRTVRLSQIKKELANMLDRPNDPQIWWERLRSSV